MRRAPRIRKTAIRAVLVAAAATLWTWALSVATQPTPSVAARSTGPHDRASMRGEVVDRSGALRLAEPRRIVRRTSDADVETEAPVEDELLAPPIGAEREPELGRLEGIITEPEGLAMIVVLDVESGAQRRIVAGSEGDFALDPLPSGRYEVWATTVAQARLGAIVQSESVEEITITGGDTTFVELEGMRDPPPTSPRDDAPTSTLRGTIVADDTGAPLPNAAILVAPVGDGRWDRSLSSLTDASGRFEIADVPCGEVRLLIVEASLPGADPGDRSGSQVVQVIEGRDTELEPLRLGT